LHLVAGPNDGLPGLISFVGLHFLENIQFRLLAARTDSPVPYGAVAAMDVQWFHGGASWENAAELILIKEFRSF